MKIKLNTIFKVEVQRQAKSSWPLIKRPRAFYILFWNIKEGTMVEKKTCISQIRWWRRWAYIMHTERCVAHVSTVGECKIYFEDFMPYDLVLEESDDFDDRINNVTNFYYWCASRMLTLDRTYAKEILNSIGASQSVTDRERAQIALSYHCLSLLDVFWVKGEKENIRFEDINLYTHSLSNALGILHCVGIR